MTGGVLLPLLVVVFIGLGLLAFCLDEFGREPERCRDEARIEPAPEYVLVEDPFLVELGD